MDQGVIIVVSIMYIILTAVMWSKNLTQSAVVISDDNDHKKESIVTFLNELLKNILPTDITNLSIWTDGPSSQFKNRYIGVVLKWVAQNFSLSIDWNYFATSHGKGPVDGIGGNVKRFAEKVVRQRNFIISNAPEFHHAVSAIQNIKTFCVLKEKVESFIETTGLKMLISNAPPIKGVSSIHMMRSTNGSEIKIFNTSRDAPQQSNVIGVMIADEESSVNDTQDIDFQTNTQLHTGVRNGAFILVVYKYKQGKSKMFVPKKLVAIVQNVVGDLIDVVFCKALTKSRFKSDDEGIINAEDILEVLPFPKCHRNVFQFEKDIDVDLF